VAGWLASKHFPTPASASIVQPDDCQPGEQHDLDHALHDRDKVKQQAAVAAAKPTVHYRLLASKYPTVAPCRTNPGATHEPLNSQHAFAHVRNSTPNLDEDSGMCSIDLEGSEDAWGVGTAQTTNGIPSHSVLPHVLQAATGRSPVYSDLDSPQGGPLAKHTGLPDALLGSLDRPESDSDLPYLSELSDSMYDVHAHITDSLPCDDMAAEDYLNNVDVRSWPDKDDLAFVLRQRGPDSINLSQRRCPREP
jgi:hypothetical protein